MASNALVARVRAFLVPDEARPAAPTPRALVPTHALVPAPVIPTAVQHAFGVARWPFVFVCAVQQWKRSLTGNTADLELAEPRLVGRTWGSMEAAVRFHLPNELGDLMKREETVVLIAMPVGDPRAEETMAAIERIWRTHE